MSTLKDKIKTQMVTAMKAHEAERVQVLRGITSAIKKIEIDERKELNDDETLKVIMKLEKQVKESHAQAVELKRDETVKETEYEISVLQEFLPKQMSEAELTAAVKEVHAQVKDTLPQGGAAMGMMMKHVMAKVGASADGKAVQAAVKSALGM
ncbi:GatB/YqeY domain-containing protein [bacterium]|nr:GatB/YqeY domain-containing protein [bacterium]